MDTLVFLVTVFHLDSINSEEHASVELLNILKFEHYLHTTALTNFKVTFMALQ